MAEETLAPFNFCDDSLGGIDSACEFFLLESVLVSMVTVLAKLLRRDPATLGDSSSLAFYNKNKSNW